MVSAFQKIELKSQTHNLYLWSWQSLIIGTRKFSWGKIRDLAVGFPNVKAPFPLSQQRALVSMMKPWPHILRHGHPCVWECLSESLLRSQSALVLPWHICAGEIVYLGSSTKPHRLGGLNNKNGFPHSSGGIGKSGCFWGLSLSFITHHLPESCVGLSSVHTCVLNSKFSLYKDSSKTTERKIKAFSHFHLTISSNALFPDTHSYSEVLEIESYKVQSWVEGFVRDRDTMKNEETKTTTWRNLFSEQLRENERERVA